jgi:phage replication O-like protein O
MSDNGWELPNYTQVPNALFEMLPDLSQGELKVLLALFRRTLGFHKLVDAVSINQLCEATGLNRTTVVTATRGLVLRRLIVTEKQKTEQRGFETTIYSLRFRESPWLEKTTSPSGNPTSPLVVKSDLQKKRDQKKRDAPESGAVEWARRHGLADD